MTDISKTTVANLNYKIEPKPEGGFIARSNDPSVQPVEGATHEEVQQKIDAMFRDFVEQRIPHFKMGMTVTINNKTTFTSATESAEADQALAELKQKIESGALRQGANADEIFDELHKIDPSVPPMGKIMKVIRFAFSAIVLLMAWYYFTHR